MVSFIDAHREAYGVEPICSALPIAPSTYHEQKARERNPERSPVRVRRDAELRPVIDRVWTDNNKVYGARRVWGHLVREQVPVARCTIERLMRQMGLKGVVRPRKTAVTSISDNSAVRRPDLVERRFEATRPNGLCVADVTYIYIATAPGVVYVAFVVDVHAGVIFGWRASTSMPPDLVLDALALPRCAIAHLAAFPACFFLAIDGAGVSSQSTTALCGVDHSPTRHTTA